MTKLQVKALPHQYETLKALQTHKNVLMLGGIGSGKTFTGALFILDELRRAYEGDTSTGIITALSYGQLRRSVLTEVFKNLTEWGLSFSYNQQQALLTVANRKKFFCLSADNSSVDKARGINAGSIWMDEAAYYSLEAYQTLMGRIRDKLGSNRALLTSSPNGFNWVYNMFKGDKHDPDLYKLVHAKTKDNIHVSEDFYERAASNLDEKAIKQELEGEFISRTGDNAYYVFDRFKHVKEVPYDGSSAFIGCDFNVDPLVAVVAKYSGGVFYVFDEVFLSGGSDTYHMAATLKERGYGHCRIIADSTYSNRKTSGKSDKAILQNAGFECLPVRNPYVRDRVVNVNRILGQRRLIIDPKCKKLIRDLEQVVFQPNGDLDQKTDRSLTHISDALGYLLWKLDKIESNIKGRVFSSQR